MCAHRRKVEVFSVYASSMHKVWHTNTNNPDSCLLCFCVSSGEGTGPGGPVREGGRPRRES